MDRVRTEFQEAVITSLKFKKRIPHLTEIVKSLQLTNRSGISVFLIKIYCSAGAHGCCVNWQWLPFQEAWGKGGARERWVCFHAHIPICQIPPEPYNSSPALTYDGTNLSLMLSNDPFSPEVFKGRRKKNRLLSSHWTRKQNKSKVCSAGAPLLVVLWAEVTRFATSGPIHRNHGRQQEYHGSLWQLWELTW